MNIKMPGTFIGNYKNVIDSLILLDNGTYKRALYSKKNILIFKNENKWNWNGENRIILDSFFVEYGDEDYNHLNKNYKDSDYNRYKIFLIKASLPIKKIDNKMYIFIESNYYEKTLIH